MDGEPDEGTGAPEPDRAAPLPPDERIKADAFPFTYQIESISLSEHQVTISFLDPDKITDRVITWETVAVSIDDPEIRKRLADILHRTCALVDEIKQLAMPVPARYRS